jgi:hypothetical protein
VDFAVDAVWVDCWFVVARAGAGSAWFELVDGAACAAKASDPDTSTTFSAVVILLNMTSSFHIRNAD